MAENTMGRGLNVEAACVLYDGCPFTYSLDVAPGECIGIVGPSGGGKSTLLEAIAGFVPLDSGDILLNGRSIKAMPVEARPVSLMFQSHNLFPHLSVADNVLLGIDPRLKRRAADMQRVEAALRSVELVGVEKRLPGELSGGQRQRVALARALLRERPILLLDEPLAALGPAQRQTMLALLKQLAQQHQLCVLLVSHQPQEIAPLCPRCVFIAEGRVVWRGETHRLSEPGLPEIVKTYLQGNPDTRIILLTD